MKEIDEKVRTSDVLVNREVKALPFDVQSPDDFHRLREVWSAQTNTPAGHERGFQAAERILSSGGTLIDVMRELRKHDFIFHEDNLDLGG